MPALVASCLRGVEAEAARQARRARLTGRPRTPPVRCAPDKVERVLLNLLTNALRHTPSDGSVAVLVEPGDEQVRVTVEDTGEGIPESAERRVFDRFWRGDPGPRATAGPASGSRSHADSSRPRAAGSGPRTAPAAAPASLHAAGG